MKKRVRASAVAKIFARSLRVITRAATARGTQALARALKPASAQRAAPKVDGSWTPGVVLGTNGSRRFRLYRPSGVAAGEQLALLVMLHGCGQDAASFATSTRMNRIALRERFMVLYPEQDRLANAQGCWNWFDTGSGRAFGEAASIIQAVDQVCLLHPVDKARVAVAGLSAGASMAALLATRYPARFKAVVMHSGIPPGAAHSRLEALGAMRGRRAAPPLEPVAGAAAAGLPPLLVIHGNADGVVAPRNAQAAAQLWAEAAGAQAGPARRVSRGKRYPMEVTDFKRRGRTAATHVIVAGLGHAWSGGVASQPFSDGQGPDASRMAWAFAAKQFRAAAGRAA